MSRDLEERLFDAAGVTVDVPDSRDFLHRLHETLRRRRGSRRKIGFAVSTAAVLLATTWGLFLNLANSWQPDYLVYDEFVLFSGIGETETVDVEWIDSSLVLEALNYLIQETDLTENGWKMVESLDRLGLIDVEQAPHSEG